MCKYLHSRVHIVRKSGHVAFAPKPFFTAQPMHIGKVRLFPVEDLLPVELYELITIPLPLLLRPSQLAALALAATRRQDAGGAGGLPSFKPRW